VVGLNPTIRSVRTMALVPSKWKWTREEHDALSAADDRADYLDVPGTGEGPSTDA